MRCLIFIDSNPCQLNPMTEERGYETLPSNWILINIRSICDYSAQTLHLVFNSSNAYRRPIFEFVDFKDKFNEKFTWKRVLNNNSIFVSCFTFQYWQKKNCFLFHSTCIDIAAEFIPNTKACSSYSSFSRGSFVLFLLLLLLFFTFFLHVYPFRCLSHSITPSLSHEFASFASLVIFIGGVLTYFAVSLCFTLFILVVAEIILSHVQCASSSLSHTHWVLMCVFVLSLSWHRQRHR